MIAVKFLRTWFFLLPFAGQDFNYDNPNKWPWKYPQCAGNRQSPIALYFLKSNPSKLPPISFHYYDVPLAMPVEATNNGHTAEVEVKRTIDGNRPSMTGGGVNDVYEVVNIHFHWGSPYKRGSEHAIGGRRYDMEMHIVHINQKYETIEEAVTDPFGLVVLGVLFKGIKSNYTKSQGLDAIYDTLPYLSQYGSKQALNQSITMQSILGDLNTKQFFTYRGSLTTPPCSEAVTWFVFPDILPIPISDLQKFFTLLDSRSVQLLNNYRPIQTNKNQRVYFRKGPIYS